MGGDSNPEPGNSPVCCGQKIALIYEGRQDLCDPAPSRGRRGLRGPLAVRSYPRSRERAFRLLLNSLAACLNQHQRDVIDYLRKRTACCSEQLGKQAAALE
jgi:hypothetical protein